MECCHNGRCQPWVNAHDPEKERELVNRTRGLLRQLEGSARLEGDDRFDFPGSISENGIVLTSQGLVFAQKLNLGADVTSFIQTFAPAHEIVDTPLNSDEELDLAIWLTRPSLLSIDRAFRALHIPHPDGLDLECACS